MTENARQETPLKDKLLLSIEEASEYSGLATYRIHELVRDPMCTFSFRVGKKKMVKRKELERFIDQNIEI